MILKMVIMSRTTEIFFNILKEKIIVSDDNDGDCHSGLF